MPGTMWDDDSDEFDEDLTLQLRNVAAQPSDEPGVLRLLLETTRGPIEGLISPVEGGTGAVVTVGGAMGGLKGPADDAYGRLSRGLADAQVTTVRLDYRQPNVFEECVLDVLAGCSFLKGIGAEGVVLVGHSFGAAVVIKAGQLSQIVTGVVSLSPQLHGTREVDQLGKPLLLVHGTEDSILSHEASEDIYRRAVEPKRLVLVGGAGHSMITAKDQLDEILLEWIPTRLAGETAPTGRAEIWASG